MRQVRQTVRDFHVYGLIGIASLVAVGMAVLGFDWIQDRSGKTTERDRIPLILDSSRVRELIHRQESFDRDERQKAQLAIQSAGGTGERGQVLSSLFSHPEKYIPARLAFMAAMHQQPAVPVVARRSYCRFLEHSKAGCSKNPSNDAYYVRVRITSGPSEGREGWACMSEDVALTGPATP